MLIWIQIRAASRSRFEYAQGSVLKICSKFVLGMFSLSLKKNSPEILEAEFYCIILLLYISVSEIYIYILNSTQLNKPQRLDRHLMKDKIIHFFSFFDAVCDIGLISNV